MATGSPKAATAVPCDPGGVAVEDFSSESAVAGGAGLAEEVATGMGAPAMVVCTPGASSWAAPVAVGSAVDGAACGEQLARDAQRMMSIRRLLRDMLILKYLERPVEALLVLAQQQFQLDLIADRDAFHAELWHGRL